MSIASFIEKVKNQPNEISFQETMSIIETYYNFTPTAFQNGAVHNAANENNGSCKLFAFAQLNALSETETLACFGDFYFEEVLKNPQATNHQNIRNFITTGWSGIKFENNPLTLK